MMRIAIVSDIHANHYALMAVQSHAEKQVDAYWFLGDAVGYGPHPVPVLDFCHALPRSHWVPGNHDAALAGELTWESFNPRARDVLALNERDLKAERPDLLNWLVESLQSYDGWVQRHGYGDDWYVLVHGALYRNPESDARIAREIRALVRNGKDLGPMRFPPVEHVMTYVKPWVRSLVLEQLTALTHERGERRGRACVFVGHTHIPCFFHLDGPHNGETDVVQRTIDWDNPMPLPFAPALINPGSVGQPRDGDPRASYAILDQDAGTITFHRVVYPVRRTQRAMQKEFSDFMRERLLQAYRPDDWPPDWKF